tara:strand:+ start:1749 stop:2270 length:522 start_codon:yes stop_codon:yes gene_type:complete
MNIDRFIFKFRNLRESHPTNSVSNDKVANFDKFLFPVDDDLLTQDYQTPAEVGLAKDEFLGVYPVMKLQLDKSSDGPSIDSMVDASKEYFNKVTAPLPQRSLNSRIENIRNLVRGINEEVAAAPTNNVGGGNIAGAGVGPQGEPGVDLRRKKARNWNPFFKDMARVMRRKGGK